MINADVLFFLQASFLIALSLLVSSAVFFTCLRYGGKWAGLHAPDSPLSVFFK
jgi:hypothetical protein